MSIFSTSDTADADNGSRLDQLKDNSLKGAGYAFLVGDASLFVSGENM